MWMCLMLLNCTLRKGQVGNLLPSVKYFNFPLKGFQTIHSCKWQTCLLRNSICFHELELWNRLRALPRSRDTPSFSLGFFYPDKPGGFALVVEFQEPFYLQGCNSVGEFRGWYCSCFGGQETGPEREVICSWSQALQTPSPQFQSQLQPARFPAWAASPSGTLGPVRSYLWGDKSYSCFGTLGSEWS